MQHIRYLARFLVTLNRYSVNMDIYFNFTSIIQEVILNNFTSIKDALLYCCDNPVSAKFNLINASNTYPNCSLIVFRGVDNHFEITLSIDPIDLPNGLDKKMIEGLKFFCHKISNEAKLHSFVAKLETSDNLLFSSTC